MDNTIMIGLSRQISLRRSMDVVANNIANANTAGFKVESVLLESAPARVAEHADGPSELQFVNMSGMGRDFSQGQLDYSGRPLDLAIDGDGFFAVEIDGEEQYTRDGRFRLDAQGQLVTGDGSAVLSAGARAPIVLDPSADITIQDGGAIMQNGEEVARIGVFEIANMGDLSKRGEGRYVFDNPAPDAVEPQAMLTPVVQQGYVEASNVQSIREMTNMMSVMRSYQSVAKFINQVEDLNKRAIERLGRVS
jgi:flagellar basal-body rod protein FlgF